MKYKVLAAGVLIVTGLFIVPAVKPALPVIPKPKTGSHASPVAPRISVARQKVLQAQEATAPVANPAPAIAKSLVAQKQSEKYVTIENKTYPLRTYRPMFTPNDPSASQWWVANTHLDQSWDIPAGSRQTVLAVIDTGFAMKHEEFAGRWYVNPGESGPTTQEAPSSLNCTDRGLPISASCNLVDDDHDGIVDNETGPATYQNPSRLNCTDQKKPLDKSCNRIDDDGNGHVDDVMGWDFINNDNSPQAGELNPNGTGTTHGTETAGIAAATGNNGKGIAGVDWNTKILPIQALDDDSTGDTLSVGRSIYYAIDRGADVISLSLGSTLPDDYVRGAVRAALAKGIVVVAAAGNDGCDCMVYPAHYPEVIGVGALNSSNQPASFSSFGQDLDLMAPGTNLTAPTWQSANPTGAYAAGLNGTSFATPMVAGMLTRIKSWQPNATPVQLTAALTENINRLALAPTPAQDAHYGFGALDASKAAARMTTPKTSFTYVFTPVSRGGSLSPNNPAEPAGNTFAYACEGGIVGSTPIFEDSQGPNDFFTMSRVENQQAIDAGYGSNLFSYGCVREPHDTASTTHNLNLFKEFKNDYQKLP